MVKFKTAGKRGRHRVIQRRRTDDQAAKESPLQVDEIIADLHGNITFSSPGAVGLAKTIKSAASVPVMSSTRTMLRIAA